VTPRHAGDGPPERRNISGDKRFRRAQGLSVRFRVTGKSSPPCPATALAGILAAVRGRMRRS
jgi:hypothetical protein